jgi:hypothetical protein
VAAARQAASVAAALRQAAAGAAAPLG